MKPDDHSQDAKHTTETIRHETVLEQDVPDPDEGDLDDLDDLLDEFSPSKVNDSQSGGHGIIQQPVKLPPAEDTSEEATEAFNKQLQEQMAALMGGMDESPAMKREIEAIMQELGTVASTEVSSESKKDAKVTPSSSSIEEPFQETIRKTMERMYVSGEQATAAAKSEDPQNILAQMMNEMKNEPLEGAGGDESFNKMLMGMMEQLTNKDILYEPMKELHGKFPTWMEKNKMTTNADDMRRYSEQQRLVREIVGRFEKSDYSDNSAEDREFIVERMQQMQAAGSPPADLVGDMNAAQDAIGDLDSGCNQQ